MSWDVTRTWGRGGREGLSICLLFRMQRFDRITINPAQMNGQPCIRGTRLTVRRVVEAVGLYPDRAELAREYPELEEEDIRQALAYAAALLGDETIELKRAS